MMNDDSSPVFPLSRPLNTPDAEHCLSAGWVFGFYSLHVHRPWEVRIQTCLFRGSGRGLHAGGVERPWLGFGPPVRMIYMIQVF